MSATSGSSRCSRSPASNHRGSLPSRPRGTARPDGRFLAFAANRGPDADLNGARDELLLLPLSGGPLESVPKPEGPIQALAWVPGGGEVEALAFVGHDHPEDLWGVTDAHLWLAP